MNLKAIITDDVPQARQLLRLMLGELAPNIEVLAEAADLTTAVKAIQQLKPDLIFLDIEMPGKSGLQILQELGDLQPVPHIIFTTAYNQYALDAFRLAAADYLLKPIREEQLLAAIQKVSTAKQQADAALKLQQLTQQFRIREEATISIPVQYGYEYLPVEDIEYIEAERAYAYVGMKDGKRKLYSRNLGYFETALQHLDSFVKVHRSYLINLHYLKEYNKADRGTILLRSGKQVELSRTHRKTFLEAIAAR